MSGPSASRGSALPSTPLDPLGDILSNISSIRIPIENALNGIPKDAPNKQELANAIRLAIAGTEVLLTDVHEFTVITENRAGDLYQILQAALAHLQDRHVYGKRAQLKVLFGRPSTPPPPYHIQIQEAFSTLKKSLTNSINVASQSATTQPKATRAIADANSQNITTQALVASVPPYTHTVSEAPPAGKRPPTEAIAEKSTLQSLNVGANKQGRWTTVVDTVEGGLHALCSATSFIPDPAGPIIRLMAGSGLTIIEMLKNMDGNREEGINLGYYIGTLIQTAERFLLPPDGGNAESCNEEAAKALQSFLDALNAVKTDLAELQAQGRFKQGVSHKSNKDDLKKWEALIHRTFITLQTQLSLSSIRLLTNMNASDALRERDRLIGLLGDGDIGATEKAADPADLMCLPGTRTAVLNLVDRWVADPAGSRVFWISGVAGCGKSAVAATIAGRPRTIPTSIAVFYFVRGNQERNKRVICSLSQQLARFGHGSLEHFILNGVKANPHIITSHLTTQFDTLILNPLKKLVRGSQPVILVIDALDEWDNQAAVLKLIQLIKQADRDLSSAVRFILTSRNEPHIVRSLDITSKKPLIIRYPLDAVLKTEAGRDIQSYIQMRIAKICGESGIDADLWPERGNVEGLVLLSDGLFQWASTVMSYIGAKRSEGRLREVLENPERYRGLDNLYQGVLDMLSREETNERVPRLLQDVLGSIITAAIPIDPITIAHLCCDDIHPQKETMDLVRYEILPSLASMFHIPRDSRKPITVSHKSVVDYLTNKDRCIDSRFYTDLATHHDRMFNSCIRLMECNLKRDICKIDDPSKLNKEFQGQVAKRITPETCYSCEHWVTHLTRSGHTSESRDRLGQFSRDHLLHWLEVLSLIGQTKRVVSIAQELGSWLLACPSLSPADELTRQLWIDTKHFVVMFSDVIATSAAHIYISAIRLAPMETEIVQQFSEKTERGVRVTGGLLRKQWPPSVWTAGGHTGVVSCALFSPDGTTILSGSEDKTLRLWDAESGAQKGETLVGHGGAVFCASFSPDGRTILSGSEDQTLRLWDAESGTQKGGTLRGHTGSVFCAMFSPDGETILSGSFDRTVRLWDAESGAQKGGPLEGHTDAVSCGSFSPDGKIILSGSHDSTVRLWDVASGAAKGRALKGHTSAVRCASFSPDGRMILSGSHDKTLRLWDAETGGQKGDALIGHADAVLCASFSPDGKTILSGSYDDTLRLWITELGAQKGGQMAGHTDVVSCASFSPDGKTIVSGSYDRTLRTWGADAGALKAEPLKGHTRGVSCFLFSPDGKTIVSGSHDKTVQLWNAETGALKAEQFTANGAVSNLSFSGDGSTLIGRTYDGSSHEWDLEDHVPAASIQQNQPSKEPVFAGSVSPEGWIFHRDIRWFWVPFFYADWLLCGDRVALRHERVVYIIDVSEIMYIVK